MSDEELVVEYINNALVAPSNELKLSNFFKLKETLLRKSPNLLTKYLQNVLNFTTDRNSDVKRALVGFIEELCKVRESLIPKVTLSLHMLLCDESVPVQKRVIQAAITIYRRTLAWLCKAQNITDEMEEAWKQLSTIKLEIANMIDSDNDGIRTSSVKFLECVVLLQTYPDETENKKTNDFSLDNVPLTLKIARRRKLEEEASNLFELLVKFHGSPHISSANLLACIGVLTNIAKTRAEFMVRVVSAIDSLYHNLPPTLTTTQVSSVKKKLKTELSNLIKHPAAFEYISSISPLLLELGVSQQEINKMIPKSDERRKYSKRTLSAESSVQQLMKKPRLDVVITPDDDDDDDDMDNDNFNLFPSQEDSNDNAEPEPMVEEELTPLQANERFIIDNLTVEKAIYLIFTNIPKLPNSATEGFMQDYAEYVKSGRVGQKDSLAQALGKQFVEANVGPGAKIQATLMEKKKEEEREASRKRERENDSKEVEERVIKKEKKEKPTKMLNLKEITKPLMKDVKEKLLVSSVTRLLNRDKSKNKNLLQKVTTTLASSFSSSVREAILTHILSDLRSNIDTALAWLFEEYSIMQGFSRIPPLRKGVRPDECYNILLCTFIQSSSQDALVLSRLLMEAPLITDLALDEIRHVCQDLGRAPWALGLLRDLTVRKPPKQLTFLNALLSYTTFEAPEVRDAAIGHVLDLHKLSEVKLIIEEFAKMNLEFLKLPKPPESLCGDNQGRVKSEFWSDEFIRACLLPYVSLIPCNPILIHDLAKIYVQTNADIKRIILRLVEAPVRCIGMENADLLKLVEDCPKGAETLITRVVHVLTDKGQSPSIALVERVRELYNTRVSDVRFLIPVLTGLTKKEVISALPKLIKLNPIVVREVFNRLLGLHGDSPITPTELLVSLHLIDSAKADLKTVIKAISLCLQEKQVFTQEVLAVVLQQLMDQIQIPTLLMRTVIQALGSYPRLSGFVMNILQRLILKQVWKQKVVWEGFIKCCQRTKPQSFAVLMQLPTQQLSDVLTTCPELRQPLRDHLSAFTEAQRSHVPASIQELLIGSYPSTNGEDTNMIVQPPVVMGVPPPVAMGVPPSEITMEQPVAVPAAPTSEPLPPGMD